MGNIDGLTGSVSGITRVLRLKSNGFYFLPLGSTNTPCLDGTFNIGVDSGTHNTESRLRIDVFSGSNSSNPKVNHIHRAIEVRYGTGTDNNPYNTTFVVSSSGNIITYGDIKTEKNISHTRETYQAGTSDLIIDATDNRYAFIQLSNNITASLVMNNGQALDVIVNQANGTSLIRFTGSYYSSSGQYFTQSILWETGSQPPVYTGTVNTASRYSFVCIKNGGNGPGALPHQHIIIGKQLDYKLHI
jgi:hypothetical protein